MCILGKALIPADLLEFICDSQSMKCKVREHQDFIN